ncbi:uncharacterized protein LACBIDRAFT_314830 [Laccaria bicolor S238N-H82]|uniref:Predicted protein n=1 Tax=Laccaria bicolor (strain S238N-H82 / ATCC MYA-4686) TaxID=486041 RepID=B0DZB4_LACBS|nr:uncharacterized protein LACBIDRAFT_314830 [Laccaria bicolor S238N-H82]EDR00090.1 predicted protein [Laccaria bicolor S238N-H82]|eukprot:XP_001889296.1 predicted protein [Laccaria bicolor S238N-H82]
MLLLMPKIYTYFDYQMDDSISAGGSTAKKKKRLASSTSQTPLNLAGGSYYRRGRN